MVRMIPGGLAIALVGCTPASATKRASLDRTADAAQSSQALGARTESSSSSAKGATEQVETPRAEGPSPAITAAIPAMVDGEPVSLSHAIVAPMDDGNALLVVSSLNKGCSIVSRAGQPETVIGMIVQWHDGAVTDVAEVHAALRPYVIVFDGRVAEDGTPGRRDVPWTASGSVHVLDASETEAVPARVRFDLHGSCCSLEGELDVQLCSGSR